MIIHAICGAVACKCSVMFFWVIQRLASWWHSQHWRSTLWKRLWIHRQLSTAYELHHLHCITTTISTNVGFHRKLTGNGSSNLHRCVVRIRFFPNGHRAVRPSCRRPKAVLFPDRSVENLLNISSRVHSVWMFWADCRVYCLGSSITDQEAAEPHYHTRGGKTHNKTEYCRGSETCITIIIISNICKTQSQLLELPLHRCSEFWWRAEPLQRYIWISLSPSQIFLC